MAGEGDAAAMRWQPLEASSGPAPTDPLPSRSRAYSYREHSKTQNTHDYNL